MSMSAREIKWAAGGFAAGFLLCYLLNVAIPPQPADPLDLAKGTPAAVWPPVPTIAPVTDTNPPEAEIRSPSRWDQPPPGVSLRAPWPGYSLDLIDTSYRLPQPPEKP